MAPSGLPASSGSQHKAKKGGSYFQACLYPDSKFNFNALVNRCVAIQPIEYLFLTSMKKLNELREMLRNEGGNVRKAQIQIDCNFAYNEKS